MDVKREFYGLNLTIRDSGSFTNESGELVNFDKYIKLNNSKDGIKLTALQLAGIFRCLIDDEEVKNELRERFNEEKKELMDVTF